MVSYFSTKGDRGPVRRSGADGYMRLALLSFAASVIGTRLYLELTGYPQIGGGELHVAHVLWGGLLLFVASLLPLTIANRWVYAATAVLSGIGMGLFIDEVGKFITRDNDYFYPAAAPIIYSVFLLTVLVYLQVRDPWSRSSRDELYRALEEMEEVLDRNLQPDEHRQLEARLHRIAECAEHPEFRRLATALLDFLRSDALQLERSAPSPLRRWQDRLTSYSLRHINAHRLKVGLAVGLGILGALSVGDLVAIVSLALAPPEVRQTQVWEFALRHARVEIESTSGLILFLTRVALDVTVGLLLLTAAAFILRGKTRPGLTLAYYSLLLSLTVANLLIFYFEQFLAAVGAVAQFSLLRAITWYREGYLDEST